MFNKQVHKKRLGLGKIEIYEYRVKRSNILDVNKIEKIIRSILKDKDFKLYSLSIIFTNDRYIKKLNNQYLAHNYVTDVLSFDYSTDKREIEGEIYISLDTVKRNSSIYIEEFKTELMRVIIHGCLHLVGYKDNNEKETNKMKVKENFYLKKYVLRKNN